MSLTIRGGVATKRWTVSILPAGKVLAAESAWGPLRIVLLVRERALSHDAIGTRLDAIVSDALEAAASDRGPRRIPSPLHHAVDALDRWRAESGGKRDSFNALVLHASDGLIGVAHLGGGIPEFRVGERTMVPTWYVSPSRGGSAVRALSMYAGRLDGLLVHWVAGTGGFGSHDGDVEARFGSEDDSGGGAAEPVFEPPTFNPIPPRREPAPRPTSEPEAPARRESMPRPVFETPHPTPRPTTAAPADPDLLEPSSRLALDREAPPLTKSVTEPVTSTRTGPPIEPASPIPADAIVQPPRPPDRGRPPTIETDDTLIVEHVPSAVPPAHAVSPVALSPSVRVEAEDPVLAGRPSLAKSPEIADLLALAEPIERFDDSIGLREEAPYVVPAASERARRAMPPPVRPRLTAAPRPRLRISWRRAWPFAAGIAALFAVGWLLGQTGGAKRTARATPSPWTRTMRTLGLGGAWADVEITSHPAGAWIAVDGKPLAVRTPATIEVDPGKRTVALSLDGLGETTFSVEAPQRQSIPLGADLRGSVRVGSADPDLPIAVELDGEARGYAPLVVEGLDPGAHLVEFTAPGMPPWSQTVEVRVRGKAEVIAHPFDAPDVGLIEVRVMVPGPDGPEPVRGAATWVDGVARGSTPLVLELPRGPHSVRIAYGDDRPPVQVIDLPGGNQRFATFQIGTGQQHPDMAFVDPPRAIPADRPMPVSVSITGIPWRDVRRMWLHARTSEGTWRRYPMTLMPVARGVVGTVVFPPGMSESGRATYYASASVASGDEYFTEIQGPTARPARSARPATSSSGSPTP